MEDLSKQQFKFLRKIAQKEKALFQVGKLGITQVFIEQIDSAIEKREIVKFNILQNSDEEIDQAAQQIAEEINAMIVQMIGNTAVLYRPSSKAKYQRISTELAELK